MNKTDRHPYLQWLILQLQDWDKGVRLILFIRNIVDVLSNEMMKSRGVRGIRSGSGGVHHAGCLESRRLIRPCLGIGYSLSSSTDSGEERGRVAGLSASCSSVSLQKHDVQHPRQQASPRNRPWTSRGRSSTEQRASEGGAALIP